MKPVEALNCPFAIVGSRGEPPLTLGKWRYLVSMEKAVVLPGTRNRLSDLISVTSYKLWGRFSDIRPLYIKPKSVETALQFSILSQTYTITLEMVILVVLDRLKPWMCEDCCDTIDFLRVWEAAF